MPVNKQELSSGENWPANCKSFEARCILPYPEAAGARPDPEIIKERGSLVIGMMLALAPPQKYEEDSCQGVAEGFARSVRLTRYERNPLNHKLCLSEQGYDCKVCGFNFETTYREIGHHFIHVHHLIPISLQPPGYIINPRQDLIPVCPNCHAMLHTRDPSFKPGEFKAAIITSGSIR